jgi:hypothetical protein
MSPSHGGAGFSFEFLGCSFLWSIQLFDFALVALPNERKTSTNGGTLAPALSMKALVS